MNNFSFEYFLLLILVYLSLMVGVIGIYIFLLDIKNKIFRSFLFFSCCLVFWGFAEIYQHINFSIIGAKIAFISGILVSFSFYFFSCFFPIQTPKKTLLNYFLIGYSLFLMVLSSTNLLVKNIYLGEHGYELEFGKFFWFYNANICLYFILGLRNLYRGFHSLNEIKRKEAKIIFFSWLFIVIIGIILNTIFPYLGIYDATLFSPFLSIITVVIFLYYYLPKYENINSRVISTELLVISLFFVNLLNLLNAKDYIVFVFRAVLLFLLFIFGWKLIKSVKSEIESRNLAIQIADEIKKANKNLKVLDKQKTQFISIASHQLRTPLTAIKGYISMVLSGDFGKLASFKVKNILKKTYESNERLIKLVDDLLNLSKMEKGIEYNFEEKDIKNIISETENLFSSIIKNKGLKFYVKLTKNIPLIKIDEQKIREVIYNLVDNAIKYTPKGEIELSCFFAPKEKILYVKVKDTGIGIDIKDQKKLFKQYSRLSNENKEGCGIGLSIAKEIVKGHGGNIWAKSEGKGKGSEFGFTLKTA